MNLLIKWFGPNWKSSVGGILSFVFVTLSAVSAWLATLPSGTHKAAWITSGISLLSGLCRVWIALITIDAGTTQALTPQSPFVPVPVPSHEVPDSPAAIPAPKVPNVP